MFSPRAVCAAAAVLLAGSASAQTVSTLTISQPILTDGAMVSGNTLYVTEGFSGTRVHGIDLETGNVSVALSGLAGPIDVAIDTQDRLYATNWNSNEIRRGPVGGAAAFWSTVGMQPDGLLFDQNGLLWCTLGVRNRIKTVDSSGVATLLVAPGSAQYPLGIAEGPDGNMYVGGLYNGVIWRVTPAGVVDSIATVPSTGQYRIGHLEAAQGGLFASALSEHAIYRVSFDGEVRLFAGTPGVAGTADGPVGTATFTSPIGLAVSDDGSRLYVTSSFVARDYVRVIDLASATDAPVTPPRSESAAALGVISPNPFRNATRIEFQLARSGVADLAVYDVHGRRIRSLGRAGYAAGSHSAVWDGRADDGEAVAGVFFVRLLTEERAETRRVVVRK